MFAVSPSKIKLFISLEIVIITFSDRTYDWLISVAVGETALPSCATSCQTGIGKPRQCLYFRLQAPPIYSMSGDDDQSSVENIQSVIPENHLSTAELAAHHVNQVMSVSLFTLLDTIHLALVSGLPHFDLPFAFTIIHGIGRLTKIKLGTRLINQLPVSINHSLIT